MKIGITSQNFRTITGHAGKTRRFLVYEVDPDGQVAEADRWDLPKTMSLHEYHGQDHPLFDLDVLITAGCGDNFRQRMQQHGVVVVTTASSDPADTLRRYLDNEDLPPAAPHDHGTDHTHGTASGTA
jgi:predicted Fe-Mo cluster-binding NifX family protein